MSDVDRQKWDARYRQSTTAPRDPESFLLELDELLPCAGRALDVAGGAGRNALWLARRGLDVTLVDISAVGLELAAAAAAGESLPLKTIAADLDAEPLPAGPWNLIVSCHFLWRPLYSQAAEQLAPGGLLIVVQPTRKNLERHASPSERFLLDDGELPSLVRGLHIVRYDETWQASGRHEARLLARVP
jgi:tellurite methyltransferase